MRGGRFAFYGFLFEMSLMTSPAKMSPAPAGTKAVLPGVERRRVSSSEGPGVRGGSVE